MTDLSPIKSQLQSFYDHEAKKYYETRKKFWKEGELLLQIIENHPLPEKVRILELGCGSGRFATYLREHYKGKFDYVGVDLSKQLLKYAQHDNPKCTFILGDISDFLAKTGQESFDLVIGTASFQHLPTEKERLFVLKHVYKLLTYDGMLILTNWSLSNRFLKKYRKEIGKACGKYLISLGKTSRRDLFIPRKNKEKTFQRYYHLFSKKELKKLTTFSGLTLRQIDYINSEGNLTDNRKESRETLLVATKSPIT